MQEFRKADFFFSATKISATICIFRERVLLRRTTIPEVAEAQGKAQAKAQAKAQKRFSRLASTQNFWE